MTQESLKVISLDISEEISQTLRYHIVSYLNMKEVDLVLYQHCLIELNPLLLFIWVSLRYLFNGGAGSI